MIKSQITQYEHKYIFLVITSTTDYREYIEMGTRFVYIGTVFFCVIKKVNTLVCAL